MGCYEPKQRMQQRRQPSDRVRTPCRNYLSRYPHPGRSPSHTSPHSARSAAASLRRGRRCSDQRSESRSNSPGGTQLAQGKGTKVKTISSVFHQEGTKQCVLQNPSVILYLVLLVVQGLLVLEWFFSPKIAGEGLNIIVLYPSIWEVVAQTQIF